MIRQQCESFGRSVFWNRQIDRENVGLYGGKKVSHFIFRFCWSRKDNSTTERWTDLLFKYCLHLTQSTLFISRKRQTCRKFAFFGLIKGLRLLKTCFVCDSSSHFGGKCDDFFHANALCVCVWWRSACAYQFHSFIRPSSVHSGSERWDDCGRTFPDELCVSSFLNGFINYAWTA